MRIFERGYKINFVDDANAFVGFDNESSCCEDFGWYLAESVEFRGSDESCHEGRDLEPYRFDREFFREEDGGQFDEGGAVAFRLTADGLPDLYLHLYNSHNGYYGHGFDFAIGDEPLKDGCL